jgi:hypothetical protein
MSESERTSLLGHKDVHDFYRHSAGGGHGGGGKHAHKHTPTAIPELDDILGESPLRAATDDNPSMRRRSRRARILARRGAFQWLPVACSNDLVHGSWWFVVGSIVATLIPIVPVVELFYPFWPGKESTLPILQDAATFGLLIFSGVFFTLGSLVFVRAFEDPPLKPLFSNEHFATDELLAAWLFLTATIPFVPFMGVYVYYNVDVLVYWGCLVASIVFVIATYFFVLSCYPMESDREQSIPQIAALLFGPKCWIQKHVCNDWLASLWLFYYGTVILCLGSGAMLYFAVQEGNQMEIFDWATSYVAL